ncbi:c-type cytochrome [Advenella mimigardefordensis]|uniref:Putative gluconate 2-dehydrogenase, cytochrome c subunit n=1 Tax=Advenella mimigardefordensis (strain DSM 17166 / LMG 22922 / DPN7) TaxID=1247726 RepID=W0PB80_ADVMD|nr:cytochrome c [Advenella mimigardefordensis]AHG62298.1 putative gluconate 2-dehydrogenase, cytochrome c subunit [Advenella mimigardefordensis DPN7]
MAKKRLVPALFLIVIVLLIIIAILWWREHRSNDNPVQKVSATDEQIERGRYAVRAADCAACHTVEGGGLFAGGFPMETPFGTVHGSNITPSADYGIGRWTREDFYRAVREGITPGGRHLYPAMPYNSYHSMSDKDLDDIYAYLMTRPAIDVPTPENDLPFPFNQRFLMIGWNLLFQNKDPLPAVSSGDSELWVRGRYLTDVLGHCAECHTPRGMFGQMDLAQSLKGGTLGRFKAADITPQALAERGWTPDDLAQFLATGNAPQGSAFSEMHMVVALSTQYLTKNDMKAMTTYLMGDQPPAPKVAQLTPGGDQGRTQYLNLCAGCHGVSGEGKPNVAPAMAGNATIRQADATNLIASIFDGLPEQAFPGHGNMQSMPGFARKLNDQQMAELVNYTRTTWGGLPGDITAAQIGALREH